MPRHHPDDTMLLSYAAGKLTEGFALVIAAHLNACGECRAAVLAYENVGGALIEALEPVEMTTDSFAKTLTRVEVGSRDGKQIRRSTGSSSLDWWRSEPLRSYLRARRPRWRPLAPGIGYSPILRRRREGVASLLLRVSPEAALPKHGHAGCEMSQILVGGYSDDGGTYEAGDFIAKDATDRHKPFADSGTDCILLVGLDGPLLFGGPVVRWLQAIAGI
jgi:putative transcriptional regulator